MKLNFDNQEIEFPCQGCGHKIKQTLGWLRANKEVTCPGCQKVTVVDTSDLDETIGGAQEKLDDLSNEMNKLNQTLKIKL